jgi:hypothetical protein
MTHILTEAEIAELKGRQYSYKDLGFDDNMQMKRPEDQPAPNFMATDEPNQIIPSLSGSKIESLTKITSKSGKVIIDLATNKIKLLSRDKKFVAIEIDGDSQIIKVGKNGRIEIDGERERILMKDNSEVNRIILDSGNGNFKLSRTGYDVLTASDNKLIWSSEFNSFKIVDVVSYTISGLPASTGLSVLTIPHSLGWAPMVFGSLEDNNGLLRPLPYLEFQTSAHNPAVGQVFYMGVRVSSVSTQNIMVWVTVYAETTRAWFNGAKLKFYCMRETASAEADVVDSYGESNAEEVDPLSSAYCTAVGQEFTGNGSTLFRSKFYLASFGSPTGNIYSKIYNSSEGSDATPEGAALATSDAFDVADVADYPENMVPFTFSGANQITLENGVHYVVTVEYSGGDEDDLIGVGFDDSSPTHSGNMSDYYSGSWNGYSEFDASFSVESL